MENMNLFSKTNSEKAFENVALGLKSVNFNEHELQKSDELLKELNESYSVNGKAFIYALSRFLFDKIENVEVHDGVIAEKNSYKCSHLAIQEGSENITLVAFRDYTPERRAQMYQEYAEEISKENPLTIVDPAPPLTTLNSDIDPRAIAKQLQNLK